MGDSATDEGGNHVEVRGRLSTDPADRELPSGSPIVSFRLVIPRATTVMTRGSSQRSDWVDCTAWSAAARRRASGWKVGDTVVVVGALRRRHYRAGEVSGSRVEIEMLGGRMVARAEEPASRAGGRASAASG